MKETYLDILQEIEQLNGKDNKFWIISRETGVFLQILLRAVKAQKVLEIGTGVGYSGLYIASILKHMNDRLYTVESNDQRFSMAQDNFRRADLNDCITQIKGHAPEILDTFLNFELDFVFLDATKIEHIDYFNSVYEFLKKGGIIAIDNSLSHYDQFEKFFMVLKKHPRIKGEILHLGSGLGVFAKT